MDENLSSYLYILQMYLKCTTFVCKNYELMKIEFHTIFIINSLKCKVYDDNKYNPWMTIDLFLEVYKNHPYMNGYRWMTLFMHRCTSLKCLCVNQQSQQ